jgi:hypothetical protein
MRAGWGASSFPVPLRALALPTAGRYTRIVEFLLPLHRSRHRPGPPCCRIAVFAPGPHVEQRIRSYVGCEELSTLQKNNSTETRSDLHQFATLGDTRDQASAAGVHTPQNSYRACRRKLLADRKMARYAWESSLGSLNSVRRARFLNAHASFSRKSDRKLFVERRKIQLPGREKSRARQKSHLGAAEFSLHESDI